VPYYSKNDSNVLATSAKICNFWATFEEEMPPFGVCFGATLKKCSQTTFNNTRLEDA